MSNLKISELPIYSGDPTGVWVVIDNAALNTTYRAQREVIFSGGSGTSGTSGTSGINGTSGTSGINGVNGTSGSSGTSGVNGVNGTSGSSGTSGVNGVNGTSGSSGTSGVNGTSGSSGTDGTSGSSGTSGVNGVNGTSGSSGTSGINGTSGSSGTSGVNGTSGSSGTSGVNGTSGSSGTDGTSGSSGTSGTSGTGFEFSALTEYTGNTFNGFVPWRDSGDTTTYKTRYKPLISSGLTPQNIIVGGSFTKNGDNVFAFGNNITIGNADNDYLFAFGDGITLNGLAGGGGQFPALAVGAGISVSSYNAYLFGLYSSIGAGCSNSLMVGENGVISNGGGNAMFAFNFMGMEQCSGSLRGGGYGGTITRMNESIVWGSWNISQDGHGCFVTGGDGTSTNPNNLQYADSSSIIGGKLNKILGTSGNKVLQSAIFGGSGNTISANLKNVIMLGTENRTGTTDNTTYVETLKAFRNITNTGATTASGIGSIVGGSNVSSSDSNGIFWGKNLNSSGGGEDGKAMFGTSNVSSGGGNNLTFGSNCNNGSYYSLVGGEGSTSSANNSGVLGHSNTNSGQRSFVLSSNSANNAGYSGILGGQDNDILSTGDDFNSMVGGSGNRINSGSQYSSVISSKDSNVSNGDDYVVMLGTSGRTSSASATTYVENLRVFRQAQYGNYNNGSQGTSYTIDWNNGNIQKITLTANTTFSASNITDGTTYVFKVQQDGSGNRTGTWDSSIFKFPSSTPPTLSTGANAVDIITFAAMDGVLYGVAQLNFG